MPVVRKTTLTVAADGVGVVSVGLGGCLTVAPGPAGQRLGLAETSVERRRVLGTADLVLGATILAGRSSPWRWRAVATRSLLHLLFADEYRRHGRRRNAVAMCALFVIDAGVAIGLRSDRRRV